MKMFSKNIGILLLFLVLESQTSPHVMQGSALSRGNAFHNWLEM